MSFHLNSNGFSEGQFIPRQYTGDGADRSPKLIWEDLPEGCQSLALICDDPDAPMGTWVHWVVYNIPPNTTSLPEGFTKEIELPDGTRQGLNDFRRVGYGGPCPPHGKAHRYMFKLYALNQKLDLPDKARKIDIERAMEGHVLDETHLMGRYKR